VTTGRCPVFHQKVSLESGVPQEVVQLHPEPLNVKKTGQRNEVAKG